MRHDFWQQLKREKIAKDGTKEPFFVLAPMADVTDYAFRQMFVRYGKPDVLYTEFVSADGLASEKGRQALLKDLRFAKNEQIIVAQIFGANPENIAKAAKIVEELGFDGVDINMGCPEKNIVRQGAGAALMKNPVLAREIIQAAKAGVREIPVSVKTRIGFAANEIETWLPHVIAEKPAAITIHGRTKKEMSEVDAHWDVIGRAVEIAGGSGIVMIGNGDVVSVADGMQKAVQSGVDGVMVGRGVFGNPWFFNRGVSREHLALNERFAVMLEHARLFEKEMRGVKQYPVMKKHFKAYVSGFDGAKELRAKLMKCENSEEMEAVIENYFSSKEVLSCGIVKK